MELAIEVSAILSYHISEKETPRVTRDVLLVDRAKLDCLEGGTHEETLCPLVNPKVKCQRFRSLKPIAQGSKNTLDCIEQE